MKTEMTQTPPISTADVETALIRRMRYHHGVPFIMSALLAVVTIASRQGYKGISAFALMALISTAFTLLCGGRFRTFFAAIAVTPPFLFDIRSLLHLHSAVNFPLSVIGKVGGQLFLWFVALPILVVWIVAKLFNRNEGNT